METACEVSQHLLHLIAESECGISWWRTFLLRILMISWKKRKQPLFILFKCQEQSRPLTELWLQFSRCTSGRTR